MYYTFIFIIEVWIVRLACKS